MNTEFPLITAFHQKHIESKRKANLNRGEVILILRSDNDGSKVRLVLQPTIQQNWTIAQIVKQRPPLGWIDVFSESWQAICDTSDRIEEERSTKGDFYPLKQNIFRVFELCPLNKVRVVILGQDPYHSNDHDGQPTAQGMSFSVRRGVNIPSSLKNIYKVLAKTVEGFKMPAHGDLSSWVYQGVFLFNTDLTVLPHKAKSHHNYWVSFTNKVIKSIVNANPNVIFLLWGREAQKKKEIIGERGTILETSHPSGFSARYGFNESDHFNQVNQKLADLKQPLINWQIPL